MTCSRSTTVRNRTGQANPDAGTGTLHDLTLTAQDRNGLMLDIVAALARGRPRRDRPRTPARLSQPNPPLGGLLPSRGSRRQSPLPRHQRRWRSRTNPPGHPRRPRRLNRLLRPPPAHPCLEFLRARLTTPAISDKVSASGFTRTSKFRRLRGGPAIPMRSSSVSIVARTAERGQGSQSEDWGGAAPSAVGRLDLKASDWMVPTWHIRH